MASPINNSEPTKIYSDAQRILQSSLTIAKTVSGSIELSNSGEKKEHLISFSVINHCPQSVEVTIAQEKTSKTITLENMEFAIFKIIPDSKLTVVLPSNREVGAIQMVGVQDLNHRSMIVLSKTHFLFPMIAPTPE